VLLLTIQNELDDLFIGTLADSAVRYRLIAQNILSGRIITCSGLKVIPIMAVVEQYRCTSSRTITTVYPSDVYMQQCLKLGNWHTLASLFVSICLGICSKKILLCTRYFITATSKLRWKDFHFMSFHLSSSGVRTCATRLVYSC